MRIDFAPMEGITGYLFRNTHHKYFSGVDRYFMPFYSPSQEHSFTRKAFQDLLPEHNAEVDAVPQLLTRRAEDFIWATEELSKLGYREVNLNLGCPSGTVTAKGKGAGFLAHPGELDCFLDKIFSACTLPISVKTRLGVYNPDEFEDLLEIYNQYPIKELTIHPRVRTDFYKGHVRIEEFEKALSGSKNPVCYNGDLKTSADIAALTARFPTVENMMIGRGLVGNPALARQLKGGAAADKNELRAFHDELFDAYSAAFQSRRNASLRMKELWFYLIHLFGDSERHLKRLRKTTDPPEFESAVDAIFRELELLNDLDANW